LFHIYQINEQTGIWPAVLYIKCTEAVGASTSIDGVLQLSQEHITMTLGTLRIKPGEQIVY